MDKINTNDPQLTELHGIYQALQQIQTIHETSNTKEITILCDCKNAVKYINNYYTPPKRYASIYQKIKEIKTKLDQICKIQIDWIPGHTDNKWNDEADRIAKIATQLHLPGNRSHHGRASGSNHLEWLTD